MSFNQNLLPQVRYEYTRPQASHGPSSEASAARSTQSKSAGHRSFREDALRLLAVARDHILVFDDQIGIGGAPWVRLTPRNATAEVASTVLVVALTTQRCKLIITPALRRNSVGCMAIVAEPSCPEPAVNAWTAQHLFRSEALDIHTSNAHHCKTGCNNSVGCNQMA